MAPSDANGNYSLPDGYLAVTGDTILASQHNPPLEDLAGSMTQRLMASGAKPMSGPLKASDGSASAPALTFNSATSTGIYKTTNGIGFSIGGVQTAELVAGGFKTGIIPIGALIEFSGTAAPALYVLPYGQTLSRTTYADLWALAQIEIANGSAFYNNGNGSTTFGIGDLRGRVAAGWDSMGGTSANRLTNADDGLNGDQIGATGGGETQVLVTANLAPYTPVGTAVATAPNSQNFATATGTTNANISAGGSPILTNPIAGNSSATVTFTGTPQGGTSTPFGVVQPTIVVNYLLFAGA